MREPAKNYLLTLKLIPTLAAATLLACSVNAQTKMEFKDLNQTASYAIGADFACNI